MLTKTRKKCMNKMRISIKRWKILKSIKSVKEYHDHTEEFKRGSITD